MLKLTSSFLRIPTLLLALIFTVWLPLTDPAGLTRQETPLQGKAVVTAHSGCLGLPDNSVAAMAAGVAAGADIVEFDLNFRADGEPVLSHDDPGDNDCETLADAFAFLAANPDVQANVDVKSTAFLEKVQSMAEAAGVLEQLFFI